MPTIAIHLLRRKMIEAKPLARKPISAIFTRYLVGIKPTLRGLLAASIVSGWIAEAAVVES